MYPTSPQKIQALPLGHLVTQISYLKITKLGTSQCLCDSPKCLNIWKYADVGYQVHSTRGLTHILATRECQIASWSKISWNSKKSARGIFGVNKADPIGYNFLSPQSWFRCVPWLVCSQDTCLTFSTFTVTHVVKKKILKTGFKYQPPRKVFGHLNCIIDKAGMRILYPVLLLRGLNIMFFKLPLTAESP